MPAAAWIARHRPRHAAAARQRSAAGPTAYKDLSVLPVCGAVRPLASQRARSGSRG